MKTLTKKQRQKVYLKVAKYLETHPDLYYLCGILYATINGDPMISIGRNYHVGDGLPEFDLFKPDVDNGALWWGDLADPFSERIICMLLCAEMCNQ